MFRDVDSQSPLTLISYQSPHVSLCEQVKEAVYLLIKFFLIMIQIIYNITPNVHFLFLYNITPLEILFFI